MKKIITIFVAIFLCVSIVACAPSEGPKNYSEHTGMVNVVGRKSLYYDPDTKIVYIIFNEATNTYQGYGYMSPYYAPNGLPYLYDSNSQTLYEID